MKPLVLLCGLCLSCCFSEPLSAQTRAVGRTGLSWDLPSVEERFRDHNPRFFMSLLADPFPETGTQAAPQEAGASVAGERSEPVASEDRNPAGQIQRATAPTRLLFDPPVDGVFPGSSSTWQTHSGSVRPDAEWQNAADPHQPRAESLPSRRHHQLLAAEQTTDATAETPEQTAIAAPRPNLQVPSSGQELQVLQQSEAPRLLPSNSSETSALTAGTRPSGAVLDLNAPLHSGSSPTERAAAMSARSVTEGAAANAAPLQEIAPQTTPGMQAEGIGKAIEHGRQNSGSRAASAQSTAVDSAAVGSTPVDSSSIDVRNRPQAGGKSGAAGDVSSELAPVHAAQKQADSEVAEKRPVSSESGLTSETVQARRQQAEAAGLEGDLKTQVLAHYQKAADLLKLAEDSRVRTANFQEQIQNVTPTREALQAQLQQELPKFQLPPEQSTAALEQWHTQERARLSEITKRLEKLEADAKHRNERRPELANKLEETRKKLAAAEQAFREPSNGGDPPALQLARKTEQEAAVVYHRQLTEQFPLEQTYYTTYSDIFLQQKDLAVRQRKHQSQVAEGLEAALAQARQRDLEQQAAEARLALQQADPALRKLAEKNAELTEKRQLTLTELSESAALLDEIQEVFERVSRKFSDAQEKEKRTGLTTSVGLLLRNEKLHLPHEHQYSAAQRRSIDAIVRIQGELFELEDQRNWLRDLEASTDAVLGRIQRQKQSEMAPEELREMTLALLQDRRKYLDDLISDLELNLHQHGELAARLKSLTEQITEFRSYIDERILWIRSADLLDQQSVIRVGAAVGDLFEPEKWQFVGERLLNTVRKYPVSSTGIGLICLLLIALQGNFQLRITQTSQNLESGVAPPLRLTLWALVLTALVACVWPFMIWMTGRQLALTSSVEEFTYSLGRTLQVAGLFFGSIELFRQICRGKGVAECHLRWPENTVRGLHRHLVGLIVVGLPLLFCLELSSLWKEGQWADSFGRMAFITGMIWFAWCLHRILHPEGAIIEDVMQDQPPGVCRLLQISYYAAVLAPLCLAGLAIWGYQYTAEQLFIRLELTMWLAIVLVVVYSLIAGSIQRAQAQLAEIRNRLQAKMRHAKKYRKKTLDAQELEEATDPALDSTVLATQIRKIVLAAGCLLFMAGSWTIWEEVLPALQRINGVELWHTTIQTTQTIDTENGPQAVPTTKSAAITLGHLLFSCGMIVMTVIAAGNLPGLMELAVLRRLPLDKGGRNAITTLTRYGISVLGGITAAQAVGISWSSVQWLVAALTVGLGFGLQEIFANFVSGLIILFERPVRIGDTVTIDGVTGTVSRIQIRATTIRDFDKKEYLVPNKEFVTGRLLNWTLSDQVNRIIVNVGIAYGSDTDKAQELMLQVAKRHPKVMVDPGPVTAFESFGDSSLNLSLRCFLPDLNDRLKVITELHTGINREFNSHGIEIPFPQMDLHVKQAIAVRAESLLEPAPENKNRSAA